MGQLSWFSTLGSFFDSDDDPQQAADYWSASGGWNEPTDRVSMGRDYDPWHDDNFSFQSDWGAWNN